MNILITGGAGFIGSNFIQQIHENSDISSITVLDNLSTGTYLPAAHGLPKVKFVEIDIRSENIYSYFNGIDVILHLAGLVSIYDCDKDIKAAYDNNVMGTINVLKAAEKAGIKRILAAETSAVYEDCIMSDKGYNETQSNPRTIYAATKACSAEAIQSFCKTRKINYTMLRFFNVYGQLQDWKRTVPPASAGFTIRLLQGKNPIIFGDPTRQRDFIHVSDVCNFLKSALFDVRTYGQTYNLGTGNAVSLLDMISSIAKELNIVDYNIDYLPEINGEAWCIKADISKAKELGWQPLKTFEKGHGELVQYLKKLYKKGTFPYNFMDNVNIDNIKLN